MDRSEHVAWCKRRALEYLDAGDLVNAGASMCSDLGKHPETRPHPSVVQLGMWHVINQDAEGMRQWIEGFN